MKKKLRTVVIMVLFACAVVGVYYKMNNPNQNSSDELDIPETKVEKLLAKDLETEYPATVKTVMNFYSQLSKCFYDGDYTEEELPKLLEQYRILLDAELIANNPEETQIESLNEEIASFGGKGKVIISYFWPKTETVESDDQKATENEAQVSYYEKDGKKYASTVIAYTIKQGTEVVLESQEKFVLRQDSEGKWKILGWKLVNKQQ